MRLSLKRSAAGLATLALATGFAACGSDSSSSDSGAKSSDPLALPDAIKSTGKLIIASDATYAPNEFIDPTSKKIVGMDADIGAAIAKKLGVTAEFKATSFDSIIPGLSASKYDLGMSSFTDTKEREATVDFVTYFSAGTSFYVKKGGTAVPDLASLCNHKVGVGKGTTQAADATAQAKKCKVQVLVYPDQNGVKLALSSDRVDVAMADSPVAAYQVKQSEGQFELSGDPYGTAPYGIAMAKDNGLAAPVLAAIKALMTDGSYKTILDKWGISAGAITDPVINGAIS